MFTPEGARERALKDWQSQTVRTLVVGTIDIALPSYRPGDSFAIETLGCELTDEADLYARTYNTTIRSLLTKYGMPGWAPVKRAPDVYSCLGILSQDARPFSEYLSQSQEELIEFKRILFRWYARHPQSYARVTESAIVVFGGSLPNGTGRIDVVDVLNTPQWMCSYILSPDEFGKFPWNT
jgi:hypothetical protein